MSGAREVLRTRVGLVWLGLVIATAVSFIIGTDHALSAHDDKTIGTSIVLAIAFVKIRFIGMHFMELREAPLPLRLLFNFWVVGVGVTVIVMFIHGQ